MVYNTARKVDLPASISSKMLMNIMIDFCLGLVPFLGDIADGVYKANTRNAWLLYCHLEEVSRKRGEANGGREKAGRRGSSRRNSLRGAQANMAAAKQQQQQQQQNGRREGAGDVPVKDHNRRRDGEYHGAATQGPLAAPEPARLEKGRNSRGGFLSRFGSNRDAEPDLERGEDVRR